MKKKDIPKPKYDLGENVVYLVPLDSELGMKKQLGKVSRIDIAMVPGVVSIRYTFEEQKESVDESQIVRRIVL